MSDYDEGYRAGMQKMREVGHARIEELKAKLSKAVEALDNLVQHTHNCEKELTEELHRQDFCGESLPLTNARTTLAELKSKADERSE